MKKFETIISNLREMMTANPPGAGGGFGSNTPKDGVDGIDPTINFMTRKKIDYRKVPKNYKIWVKDVSKK